jgi:hypothetical protein
MRDGWGPLSTVESKTVMILMTIMTTVIMKIMVVMMI